MTAGTGPRAGPTGTTGTATSLNARCGRFIRSIAWSIHEGPPQDGREGSRPNVTGLRRHLGGLGHSLRPDVSEALMLVTAGWLCDIDAGRSSMEPRCIFP